MTSINSTNSSSSALLLLQQTRVRPLSGNGDQNATGTILDTVSSKSDVAIANIKRLAAVAQETKGTKQTATTPRQAEATGTVSVAASSAWKSGMASVGAAEIGAAGTSIARTVDNAEFYAGSLALDIIDYNRKFNLKEIETPEEWAAYKDAWLAKEEEMGVSEEHIANGLKMLFEEGGYERHVSHIEVYNQGQQRYSEIAEDALRDGAPQRLKEAFGINVQISYDNEGRASVAPFDIYYRNGQKMLSYGEDGSLTSYNADGTVKLALNNNEAAKIPGGYYRS